MGLMLVKSGMEWVNGSKGVVHVDMGLTLVKEWCGYGLMLVKEWCGYGLMLVKELCGYGVNVCKGVRN